MSCIVRAQRRVCKRRVTLGHGLEWAHKIQTETQIDLIETRIRNGLVRRGRSLPSIFAAWLRPTCHLGDFRTFMYKMMHPPPSETTRRATWVLVRVGPLNMLPSYCTFQNSQLIDHMLKSCDKRQNLASSRITICARYVPTKNAILLDEKYLHSLRKKGDIFRGPLSYLFRRHIACVCQNIKASVLKWLHTILDPTCPP